MLPAEVLPSEFDRIGREGPKRKLQGSHRRALSDGVMLVEERYLRVENCAAPLASAGRPIALWLARASLGYRTLLIDGVASVSARFFLRPVAQLVRSLRV
jgi:hypothetical protein